MEPEVYEPMEQRALSLNVFFDEYAARLPQAVVVHESLYGVGAGLLINGQQLEVYFHRETPVVTMELSSGKNYIVPVNTTFKFSTLYNPDNDLVKARQGYVFKTVADLIKANPLPNAVYVSKEFTENIRRKSNSVIVHKGQILILTGIQSRLGKTKKLKCITVDGYQKLYLKENCEGYFSTQESLLLFPLPVLLKQFPMPLATSLYHSDGQKLYTTFKNRSAVIFGEQSIRQSIIASTKSATASASLSSSKLIEIYCLPLEFHVAITNSSEAEMEQLKLNASTLSRSITPEYVTNLIYNTSSTEDALQYNLLLPVNNKEWAHGINPIETIYEPLDLELFTCDNGASKENIELCPPIVPPRLKPKTGMLEKQRQSDTFDHPRHAFDPVATGCVSLSPPIPPRAVSESLTSNKPLRKAHSFTEPSIVATDNPSYGAAHYPKGSQPTRSSRMSLETPSSVNSSIHVSAAKEKEIILKKRVKDIATLPIETENDSVAGGLKSECEGKYLDSNKKLLFSYNTEEVISLLGKMGLSQYGSKFEEEFIDGRLFFELDDNILEDDLGVVKRIHRIRLLRLINGIECVSCYLK